MTSLATAEPPGESTRNTIALMPLSSRASRKALRIVSLPITTVPDGSLELRPVMMRPLPVMTAMRRPLPRPARLAM
jgi:hypothetical protein